MSKCPRCFWLLHPKSYLWSAAGGDRYRDDIATAYSGDKVQCGRLFGSDWDYENHRRPPTQSEATQALGGPVVELCPMCHFHLPPGLRDAQVTCIAMAGARATGKSLYIAVMIRQLELLCESTGVSMEPANRSTSDAYEQLYGGPLFVQRGLLEPTKPVTTQTSLQREPLLYALGSWNNVPRYLAIRDVAGEDLEAGDLHTPPFRFFSDADAVFFLFDPLRVPTVRDQLQDLHPNQNALGGDPRSVLNHLRTAIGNGNPKLAVILSKFDALRALRDVEGTDWSRVMSNDGAAFNRDTSASRNYDEQTGQLLHEEVRSLLHKLNAGPLVTAVENPSTGSRLDHRYFAISSLGQPPSGTQLHTRGIAPFRVTDPIRWVASQYGVLTNA